MSTQIYHNPRCRKSREALQLLEENNIDFEIIKYLDEVPSELELKALLKMLNLQPIELVRKNEKIWKESYKGKTLSDADVIKAMHQFPKLIERPILVHNNKAVVGRPPEKILDLIA